MAVDFFFHPPTIALPEIAPTRAFRWGHLPNDIAHAIAYEEQYLFFQFEMLEKLHFTEQGQLANKPWIRPLGLSVRAGTIKAAILVSASICEAVLRALGEARQYDLPKNARHRTMGKVLEAWQDANENPFPDVAPIWDVLQQMHSIRNNIHLFKAVEDGINFEGILAQEENLMPRIQQTIAHLSTLRA
jgi:hypothetical protein